MPIVFEEVTGEVDSTRGSGASDSSAPASGGPSSEELLESVTQQLQLMAERAQRSRAD